MQVNFREIYVSHKNSALNNSDKTDKNSATLEQKKNTTTLTGTETEAAAKILICARLSLKVFVKTPSHRLRFLRLESRRFTMGQITDVTKVYSSNVTHDKKFVYDFCVL